MNNAVNFKCDKEALLIQLFPFMLYVSRAGGFLTITIGIIVFNITLSMSIEDTMFD
tara:strand:- start:254 stop:421 length:168 start_codon:yes stop_codon:yes gene_type:complete